MNLVFSDADDKILSSGYRFKTGRPGMSPVLKERIVSMRESGLTLNAIADQLNREGKLTTSQGGSEWRNSSVRSVLVNQRKLSQSKHR